MKTKFLFILFQFFRLLSTVAQEEKAAKEDENLKGNHRLTLGLGHTFLANGINAEGKKVWLAEPSWSLSYDYWINNRWAIGLQSDIIIERFVVEDNDNQELEREHPISLVPVAIFKPFRHFSFFGGAGIEFENNKNLGLTRLGSEFGLPLSKTWEAGIAAIWDNKWGYYNSWTLEFTFSRIFSRNKAK